MSIIVSKQRFSVTPRERKAAQWTVRYKGQSATKAIAKNIGYF